MEGNRGSGRVAMLDLRYHQPSSVRDACMLGRRLGASGVFLAGGTELLPDYRRGRESATELISLRALHELRGIAVDGDVLRVGSLATVAELARSVAVERWLPALSEAARALGSPSIRSRATVGGNFCRAVSCADLPPAALIGNATLRIASSDSIRDVAASEFFVGARRTILQPGELLVEVRIPRPPHGSGTSFERFGLRKGLALAVASVAARVQVERGRIVDAVAALGAVAPTPLLVANLAFLLRGKAPTTAAFELAATACVRAAEPINDVRGSAGFRREIVAVLARRALERAVQRAFATGVES